MGINATDYQEYDTRHTAITALMGEIAAQVEEATANFNQGMDESVGTWSDQDRVDWGQLNKEIREKMEKMELLMSKARRSQSNLAETEKAHTGFTYEK